MRFMIFIWPTHIFFLIKWICHMIPIKWLVVYTYNHFIICGCVWKWVGTCCIPPIESAMNEWGEMRIHRTGFWGTRALAANTRFRLFYHVLPSGNLLRMEVLMGKSSNIFQYNKWGISHCHGISSDIPPTNKTDLWAVVRAMAHLVRWFAYYFHEIFPSVGMLVHTYCPSMCLCVAQIFL